MNRHLSCLLRTCIACGRCQVCFRLLFTQKCFQLMCDEPSLGVQVRVVDEKNNDVESGKEGEIIAQSDSIMVEYRRKPEEMREAIIDGWLHTGDMAYYDIKKGSYISLIEKRI